MNPEQEYAEPNSPFDSHSQQPGPEPEPEGKQFDFWGLRNTEPHVTPSDVGYQLDLAAEWYEHLFCGFLKQSNSDAAEAWQHYAIALILLADKNYGLLSDEDREDLEDQTDGWEMPQGEHDAS